MTNRKNYRRLWAGLPLIYAFTGFYRVTQSPSFGMYRTVDIVQFLLSGVCFGVAMVLVIVGPHAKQRAREVLIEKRDACSDPDQMALLTSVIEQLNADRRGQGTGKGMFRGLE
jgi:hypothetical protein